MKMPPDLSMTFHVEPADRAVGIMTEGFSAWDNNGELWCNLDDITPAKFSWYSNETGDEATRPPNASVIERLLHMFAENYYMSED